MNLFTERISNMKRISALVIILSMIAVPGFAQTFSEDWESGKLGYWRLQGTNSDDYNPVSSKESLGKHAFRSYLKAVKASSPRYEIVRYNNYEYDYFKNYGLRVAIYFPSNWKPDNANEETIMQIHGIRDKHDTWTKPPLALILEGNKLGVKLRWIKSDPGSNNTKKSMREGGLAQVTPGKWHYFYVDFNIDYRSGGNGFMRIYMKKGGWPSKSDKIYDYKGPWGSKDKRGHYSKFGIYKWPWRDADLVKESKKSGIDFRELYYDNIQVKTGSFAGSSSGSSSNDESNNDSSPSPSPDEETPVINGFGVSAGDDFNVDVEERNFDLWAYYDDNAGITKFEWTKISGPKCGILEKRDGERIHVHGINEGQYEFQIKVWGSGGKTATDRITVTVYDGAPPPEDNSSNDSSGSSGSSSGSDDDDIFVSAGPDFTVKESDRNFDIWIEYDDEKVDVDKITWTKVSGPQGILDVRRDGERLHVHNIEDGVFVLEVKIEDKNGNTGSDRVKVTVTNNVGSTINSSDEFDDFIQESMEYGVTKNFMTDGNPLKIVNGAGQIKTVITLLTIEGRPLNGSYRNGYLDTNELSPGMYIYNVVDEEGMLVQKGRIIRR